MTEPKFFLAPLAKGPTISINAAMIAIMAPSEDGEGTIVELLSGKQLLIGKKIHEVVPGYPQPAEQRVANDLPADR
jgi:hypothetical protein